MTQPNPLEAAGLGHIAAALEELWECPIGLGPARTILGAVRWAGGTLPLPSTAAELQVGSNRAWIPVPAEPAESGRAPVYLYSGRRMVLPFIRLCTRPPAAESGPAAAEQWPIEYLTLSDWVEDALTRWRFVVRGPRKEGASPEPASALEQLRRSRAAGGRKLGQELEVIARLIAYALFGSAHEGYYNVTGSIRLVVPACPMWLRPMEEGAFGAALARTLVVTARLEADRPRPDRIPAAGVRGKDYRIRPAAVYDWGLDPVHTPEGADIRLTGRLGQETRIERRRLVAPQGDAPQLGLSTRRIPFAGYDDPRRLLMAANMQTHAVPLTAGETPLVRIEETGVDPPGVNLRVGYLAWRGLNHEDAWVVSESAARRLHTTRQRVQVIPISAVELMPEVLVAPGQTVRRGQPLVRRYAAPGLLTNSLTVLARLSDPEDRIPLAAEPGDLAPLDGQVAEIQQWDLLTGEGVPADWERPASLAGRYRAVLCIKLVRQLPLAVGDKLANRHGHKGIVGAILPDAEMPRWRGRPLEALIDPISVLNRSNWGQIHEALAGAAVSEEGRPGPASAAAPRLPAAADRDGQTWIEPPAASGWLTRPVRAIAGVQFVMRLPHHACEKLSICPQRRSVDAGRPQRLGEMDQWALWAHAANAVPDVPYRLSPAALSLQRLLAGAGYELHCDGENVRIGWLPLDGPPPTGDMQLRLHWRRSRAEAEPAPESRETATAGGSLMGGTLAQAYAGLDGGASSRPAVLVFDPPLTLPDAEQAAARWRGPWTRLQWLPIVPSTDRPRPEPGTALDVVTQRLRAVVASYRRAAQRSSGTAPSLDETGDVVEAVRALLTTVRVLAIGRQATGAGSSKLAALRRRVLGQRLRRSARATAAPAGALHLGLDEVGVPEAIARALFESDCPLTDAALDEALRTRWVWLKRDPVLHRWGLLPVRLRLVPGDVVRLPASLLGPMGADFDGDTVALFGDLPHAGTDPSVWRPSTMAWDPLMDAPAFVPGKQYLYGLYLLMQPEHHARRAAFQAALAAAGAPQWPETTDRVKDALGQWVRAASHCSHVNGQWWAILEDHALAALAHDPGLGLALVAADRLAALPAVVCGAAKGAIFAADARIREPLEQILSGHSLQVFARCRPPQESIPPEPIAQVMVAAKQSVGLFGGALRRILYTAQRLDASLVRHAQCLTEQATQKVLSVKAGKEPMRYYDYGRQLQRLLRGEPPDVTGLEPSAEELRALVQEPHLAAIWHSLRSCMVPEPPAWQRWLLNLHELPDLLRDCGGTALLCPSGDLRVGVFLAKGKS